MNSPKCIKCGLYNFAGATACKRCQQPILYQPPVPPVDQMNQLQNPDNVQHSGGADMLIGGVICLIGVVITVGSYSMASSSPKGGSYTIAWGAIVFGGIRFLKGMVGRS
jgi:hypothetical protein